MTNEAPLSRRLARQVAVIGPCSDNTPASVGAPQFELKNYAWCFGQMTGGVFDTNLNYDLSSSSLWLLKEL